MENPTDSILPGVNVLLMGPSGTGKTHSIGTIVDLGIETFYLALEPGLETLRGYFTDRKLPIPDNLHWHVLQSEKKGLASLIDMADKTGKLSYESLTKMQDPTRTSRNRYVGFLNLLANFPDQRTGKSFGNVGDWGPDKVLVIDGLSGIGELAFEMVSGNKPTRAPSEYGVAQNNMLGLIREITNSFNCHFILLSHITRETDEILGGTKIFAKTPGKALNSELPQLFSDVILAVRNGKQFTWSTASALADTKTRNLPIEDNMVPTFKPILDKWVSRGGSYRSSNSPIDPEV